MVNFQCNGICHRLEGYEKGSRYFAVEGKKYCSTCNYKIKLPNRMCPCCHIVFRRAARKNRYRNDPRGEPARVIMQIQYNNKITRK